MAPDEIFSYIPTPEHPNRLRQMLPTDSDDGLALLAFYRNSFVKACAKKDQNTADCILDIIIHLRYRLIKLGEFLEDPASHLFAIYYEQTLPCMIYGTPLKIDFSPACDLLSLMDEIDIDEGICIADDAVKIQFGDINMSEFEDQTTSANSVETKKGKKKRAKKTKLSLVDARTPIERNDFYPKFNQMKPDVKRKPDKKVPDFDFPEKRRIDRKESSGPIDLGHIECDILDCLGDLVVCDKGKEAVALLEVLHPVDVVQDGTICVKRKRLKVGYEAADFLFRGCPSSREWLLSRQL